MLELPQKPIPQTPPLIEQVSFEQQPQQSLPPELALVSVDSIKSKNPTSNDGSTNPTPTYSGISRLLEGPVDAPRLISYRDITFENVVSRLPMPKSFRNNWRGEWRVAVSNSVLADIRNAHSQDEVNRIHSRISQIFILTNGDGDMANQLYKELSDCTYRFTRDGQTHFDIRNFDRGANRRRGGGSNQGRATGVVIQFDFGLNVIIKL